MTAEDRLDRHADQLKNAPTTKEVKEAIEGTVATAVDDGEIHAMAREALDTATIDDQFLAIQSAAFLNHASARGSIKRFTTTLVEQVMNDYLEEQPHIDTNADPLEQHRITNTSAPPAQP